jgi:hypothetical protein
MPGELSRRPRGELPATEPEYINYQEGALKSSLKKVNELYDAAKSFPHETRDAMESLALALLTVLEEQHDLMHPPAKPRVTNSGKPYHHRDEALMHIEHAAETLRSRDIRTINTTAEPAD